MFQVQDVAFTLDSRWVAISTIRGTTHVFPITPYGGRQLGRSLQIPVVSKRIYAFGAAICICGERNIHCEI